MSTGDHGETPYELTRNPVDQTYGFVCREHAIHRAGLTHQHAINTERKHIREQHPDPLDIVLDLSAVARSVLEANLALSLDTPNPADPRARIDLWAKLVGAENEGQAIDLAQKVYQSETPVRAAVVPL